VVAQWGLGCRTVLAHIHIGEEMRIGCVWVSFIIVGKKVDNDIIWGNWKNPGRDFM